VVLQLTHSTVVIPMSSMFDLEAERKRLQKETDQSQDEMDRLKARLDNQEFLTKAPKSVIDKEREKLYTITDRLERLKEQINKL
jgi:valyl-tRNA synthetase